jgi:hypothetical protein
MPVAPADRPRERRRRPKPPPPAPVPVVKILLGIGLLVSLVLGAGGFLVWRLANRPADWRTHESARGGYKIEMPAAPRNDIASRTGIRHSGDNKIEGTLYRGKEFVIVWSDFPGGREFSTDEELIDASINGLREDSRDWQITVGPMITVGEFSARDVTFAAPDAATYIYRVVVTDARLYFVIAAGGFASDDPDVRRFVDSFEVTDPKSKSLRQRQVAGARGAQE